MNVNARSLTQRTRSRVDTIDRHILRYEFETEVEYEYSIILLNALSIALLIEYWKHRCTWKRACRKRYVCYNLDKMGRAPCQSTNRAILCVCVCVYDGWKS